MDNKLPRKVDENIASLLAYTEGYIQELIQFDIPKVEKLRLPVLSADEVIKVL